MTVWADDIYGEGFLGLLVGEEQRGYIRSQHHPNDELLRVHKYTEKAVYERRWNVATTNARGLITFLHDGLELEIVARPFPKFWNVGEASAPEWGPEELVTVFDKRDGSLGTLYDETGNGEPAIATLGSFASDQAKHATGILWKKYLDWARRAVRRQDVTWLFEITYPENRIVVDYGDQDDIVLLGGISKATGEFVSPYGTAFMGPRVETLGTMTFREALELPDREGQEGLVLYNRERNERLKAKQADYVALHRVVTNLNDRVIWEAMKNGTFDDLYVQLPEEFQDWADDVADKLQVEFSEINAEILDDWDFLRGTYVDRKSFAERARLLKYPWAMFSLLDGKDINAKIWDLIKPAANQGPNGEKASDDESLRADPCPAYAVRVGVCD